MLLYYASKITASRGAWFKAVVNTDSLRNKGGIIKSGRKKGLAKMNRVTRTYADWVRGNMRKTQQLVGLEALSSQGWEQPIKENFADRYGHSAMSQQGTVRKNQHHQDGLTPRC